MIIVGICAGVAVMTTKDDRERRLAVATWRFEVQSQKQREDEAKEERELLKKGKEQCELLEKEKEQRQREQENKSENEQRELLEKETEQLLIENEKEQLFRMKLLKNKIVPFTWIQQSSIHIPTLPTLTLLPLTCTQVLWFLAQTNPHSHSCVSNRFLGFSSSTSKRITQVPRFLKLYLKEDYDFFGGIDV